MRSLMNELFFIVLMLGGCYKGMFEPVPGWIIKIQVQMLEKGYRFRHITTIDNCLFQMSLYNGRNLIIFNANFWIWNC